MHELLEKYKNVVSPDIVFELQQITKVLKGIKVVHINSTNTGGGVAEILSTMVPLTTALGIDNHWEVIEGNPEFFEATKNFHNAIQNIRSINPTSHQFKVYEQVNAENAERLRSLIESADVVVIHDPQPAALINHFPDRKNKWVWRCHIDASNPQRTLWKFLRNSIAKYDACIFSLADFAQPLPPPLFVIPPSIDPLSDKNRELSQEEINAVFPRFGIDPNRPIALQVSRFDYFKDPLGVIQSYLLAKKFKPALQLVLAGGGAPDDPEGERILEEVKKAAEGESDIHILFLPADSHKTINALQRASDIVIQKSIKEGFGLTVTESLWKNKPVIGGNSGGIRLQVINHHTGFLVDTPEGAAEKIRYLLQTPHLIQEMGAAGHRLVLDNFLITRQVRDYLTVILSILHPRQDNRIEINKMGVEELTVPDGK